MEYLVDRDGRVVLPRRLGCPYPRYGEPQTDETITIVDPREKPDHNTCPYCGVPQCESSERLLQTDWS